MIKIGIIDDNKPLTDLIADYLSSQIDMRVVGVAHNGLEGLELIRNEEPDLVILDLIMPHSDGLYLLEQLYNENNHTKVLMLTAFGKEEIIKKASELGVSYFLLKPFELTQLYDTIHSIYSYKNEFVKQSKEIELYLKKGDENLEIRITELLRLMGIPANLKGYIFLREAIKMVILNGELMGGLTKLIYPAIAAKFHTTSSRVERAIRHAIEVGWNRGSLEQLDFVFGNTVSPLRGKPTNGEFIALISDHLHMQTI